MRFYFFIMIFFLSISCQQKTSSMGEENVSLKENNSSKSVSIANISQKNASHQESSVCHLISAPIDIQAKVNDGEATIYISFQREAENVSIQIYGTKKLSLNEDKLRLSGGSFGKGETVQYIAHFPKGSKNGRLAVHVSAEFSQKMQSKTCSFALPFSDEEEILLEEQKNLKVDQNGRLLKVLPMTPKSN